MSVPIDRSTVERLVRTTLSKLGESSAVDDGDRGLLLAPDRGRNLGVPFDPDAMAKMLLATPARIGVGRAGIRYRTNTLLRFRADHAAAKDAVMSEVDEKLIAQLGLPELATRAPDKRTFLERPDAGRVLSDESRERLATLPHGVKVQVCYGDGLSAAAINAHLAAFHNALMPALKQRGFSLGTPVFVRHSRVKVMDEIARLVDAEACVFTCGERPGLGFADSLSSYYIYQPQSKPVGATDADREVISNINPRGLSPDKAAHAVAEACARILANKKSGVIL
jgi:ethanolamine ammonia-lyase small subunit